MVADSMKTAVDGLAASRAARHGDLARIKTGVRKTMEESRRARKASEAHRQEDRRRLRMVLGAGRAALKGDVGSLRQEAGSELAAVRNGRIARSQHLRAQLRQGARASAQRVSRQMSQQRQQRTADAARSGQQRRQMINTIDQNVDALRQAARTVLDSAHSVRQQMAQALSAQLGADISAIRQAVSQARSISTQERNAARNDLAQARAQWQSAGKAPPAPPKRAPARAATVEPAPQAPEPPAVHEEEPGPNLANRLFDYLANHPDGARARDMEEILGSGRFQIMRALRTLLEEGRVRRQDDLYFAQ